MPSHEEHCRDSVRKYGKAFSDLHHWMDEPSTLLGKGHRVYRHDPIRTPPLAKKIFGELADQACLDHIRLDELESRRMQSQQPLELTNQTEWFVNFLFPPLKDILNRPETSYGISNFRFLRIPLFYNPTDSFSTRKNVVDKLAEWAIEKYGRKNVNARIAREGSLGSIIKISMDKKPVQIYFVDQFTLFLKSERSREFMRERSQEYLALPNTWAEETGRKNGLIVVFLAFHTFKVPSEFMYDCSAILFRNSPTTRQDYNEMMNLVGEEAIAYLKELELERKKKTDLCKISLFWANDKIGILETPPAKKDYWKDPPSLLEILERGL